MGKRMREVKFEINGHTWLYKEVDNENVYMQTTFPNRLIETNPNHVDEGQLFEHCLIHELTHAYQAEMGMWQNILGNGSKTDEFDCEWIAEFVAINIRGIIATYDMIVRGLNQYGKSS